jgi:hypothetical protein
MIRGRLCEYTDADITNVLVYISDSLRYGYLPDVIRELGVCGRAIATSTFTASGYSSILTGTYPSTHRVWNFQQTLAERPALLSRSGRSGIDATHVWSNVNDPAKKPPLRICGESEETTLSEMESPFTLVVHNREVT